MQPSYGATMLPRYPRPSSLDLRLDSPDTPRPKRGYDATEQ